MTAAELAAAGRMLFGDRWQSALARALGIELRTLQRWAAGTSRIAEGAAAEIGRLARHRWTVGTAIGADGKAIGDIIVHHHYPRFRCRLVETDVDGLPARDMDQDARLLGPLTYSDGLDLLLCEFAWLDDPPAAEAALRALLAGAIAAHDAMVEGQAAGREDELDDFRG